MKIIPIKKKGGLDEKEIKKIKKKFSETNGKNQLIVTNDIREYLYADVGDSLIIDMIDTHCNSDVPGEVIIKLENCE